MAGYSNWWVIGFVLIVAAGAFIYFNPPPAKDYFSQNKISLDDCPLEPDKDFAVCCLRNQELVSCDPGDGEFVFARVNVERAVEIRNSEYNDSIKPENPYVFCIISELDARGIESPKEYEQQFYINVFDDNITNSHLRCTYPRSVIETKELVAFGLMNKRLERNYVTLADIKVQEGADFNPSDAVISLTHRIYILVQRFV